jgi:hypothetical protein
VKFKIITAVTISVGYSVKMKVSVKTDAAFLRQISLFWAEDSLKKSDEFVADDMVSITESHIFVHNYV